MGHPPSLREVRKHKDGEDAAAGGTPLYYMQYYAECADPQPHRQESCVVALSWRPCRPIHVEEVNPTGLHNKDRRQPNRGHQLKRETPKTEVFAGPSSNTNYSKAKTKSPIPNAPDVDPVGRGRNPVTLYPKQRKYVADRRRSKRLCSVASST